MLLHRSGQFNEAYLCFRLVGVFLCKMENSKYTPNTNDYVQEHLRLKSSKYLSQIKNIQLRPKN